MIKLLTINVKHMGGNMLILIGLSLCVLTNACAKSDCGPYGKAEDDVVTKNATALFLEHTQGRIQNYDVSRRECSDKIIIVFEGKGEDANFGNHWIIWYTKASGRTELIDGI